jgi:hypothetical protein
MKAGKTYRRIGQVRARERIRGEREVVLLERGNGLGRI